MRKLTVLLLTLAAVSVAQAQAPRNSKVDIPLRNWAVTFQPAAAENAVSGRFVATTNALPSAPTTFIALPPCRLVDTRDPAGPFGAPKFGPTVNLQRTFNVPAGFNTTHGLNGNCGTIPAAAAYSLSFTIVDYSGRGAVRTFPTGGTPKTAVMNLGAAGGNPIGNAVIAAADASGNIDVQLTNPVPADPGQTNLVIDINGYFIENATPDATPNTLVLRDVNGSFSANQITATKVLGAVYQDLAEWVPTNSELRAGMVVVLDPADGRRVVPSAHAYDTAVAGVVSENPGIVLGTGGPEKSQIATTGRVRVLVDADAAPIRVGDLLVTSSTPGVAMRSTPITMNGQAMHRPGTIIGKAMEPLASGRGEIMILLSLQ